MKKIVFISSTYNDLKKHRKKVWEKLSTYDVNIRGMEQFGARKETPIETCISEVEQSDIYVGIIAFKLGSIDVKSGKSFTQLEYEKALELEKEILIYFMDDINGEITPQNIDFNNKHNKLNAFKTTLKENHTIDIFINENDLADKLDRKFNELLSKLETEDENLVDEYSASKKAIELFLVLPRAYSNKEVRLKVKKNGKPFSAAKSICDNFNFEYGKTLVQPIEVIEPKIKEECFNHIIADYEISEKLFEIEDEVQFEIYAKLLFSKEVIENIRANFFPTYKTKTIENPNYDPNLPEGHGVNSALTMVARSFSFDNRKYIEATERVEGEGKIILLLRDIIDEKTV